MKKNEENQINSHEKIDNKEKEKVNITLKI
jgi:hypothetical protein